MNLPTVSSSATPDLLDAALHLAQEGYLIFPCQPRSKIPAVKTNGFKAATRDEARISQWWNARPRSNIGLVSGGAKQIVIDIDGEEGMEAAKALGLWPTDTRMVRTSRGYHLYFLHPGEVIGNKPLASHLDVRADRGYVLAPPSIHPSGAVYEWVDSSAKVLPLPELVADQLRGIQREGSRNNALASFLGGVRRKGADEQRLMAAADDFNRLLCKPPLPADEVRAVARSIAKYPSAPEETLAAIAEINNEFGVVQIGGKVRILCERGDDVDFLGLSDFSLLLRPRKAFDGDKLRPLSEIWLSHPQRRQYAKLVFEPGTVSKKEAYNLWRGWGVQSVPGDCSLFLQHLRDIVCSGDEELYVWLFAWFAHIIRHPRQKIGSAVVLRGRQGTGKSIVGNVFGRIIGKAYKQVASSRHVTGNFNAHLGDCLLLHADEAFWAGDKAAEGILKDLVTSSTMLIERKGIDVVEARNYVRLFVTSNADWVVPAGLEERRFCVIDISEARMQDKPYFAAMMQQMESGGYEALLHTCQQFSTESIDLRTIPQTSALAEQKVASLSSELAWWLDVLQRGYLPGAVDGSGLVAKDRLYRHYVSHAERTGIRRKSIETQIGIFLKRHVPGLRQTRARLDGNPHQEAAFEFPSLGKCREGFSKLIRAHAWDEPWDWQPDPSALGGGSGPM